MLKRLQEFAERSKDFVLRDIWDPDLGALPRLQRSLYSCVRIVYLVVRGFIHDTLALQASALTYFTLMTVIPTLALIFAFARFFGAEERLQNITTGYISQFPAQVREVVDRIFQLADETNFAALGIIGFIFVLVTAVRVVARLELTFNTIWGVREGRPLVQKFAYYTCILLLVPFLVVLASTANAFLTSDAVNGWLGELLGPLADLYGTLMSTSGIVGIILGFCLLYLGLPNTRVRLTSALVGGVIAGLSWASWQWICMNVTLVITRSNAIYGAFAALPVSLFWLQVNWIIVLLGAEFAFAWQHFGSYQVLSEFKVVNVATRRYVAFYLVYEICQRFRSGNEAWSLDAESEKNPEISVRLIKSVLYDLKQAGLILETDNGHYVPGRETADLTLADIEEGLFGTIEGPAIELGDNSATDFMIEHHEQYREALTGKNFADILDENGEGS